MGLLYFYTADVANHHVYAVCIVDSYVLYIEHLRLLLFLFSACYWLLVFHCCSELFRVVLFCEVGVVCYRRVNVTKLVQVDDACRRLIHSSLMSVFVNVNDIVNSVNLLSYTTYVLMYHFYIRTHHCLNSHFHFTCGL